MVDECRKTIVFCSVCGALVVALEIAALSPVRYLDITQVTPGNGPFESNRVGCITESPI